NGSGFVALVRSSKACVTCCNDALRAARNHTERTPQTGQLCGACRRPHPESRLYYGAEAHAYYCIKTCRAQMMSETRLIEQQHVKLLARLTPVASLKSGTPTLAVRSSYK